MRGPAYSASLDTPDRACARPFAWPIALRKGHRHEHPVRCKAAGKDAADTALFCRAELARLALSPKSSPACHRVDGGAGGCRGHAPKRRRSASINASDRSSLLGPGWGRSGGRITSPVSNTGSIRYPSAGAVWGRPKSGCGALISIRPAGAGIPGRGRIVSAGDGIRGCAGASMPRLIPAVAILEDCVHKGFRVLDTAPTADLRKVSTDPSIIHVVRPRDIPIPGWLGANHPRAGPQGFRRPSSSGIIFSQLGIPSTVIKR